ncbi:MAG: hypothetical protein J6A01_02040 [Proteobacteria bacterium]|nr:hypothetical protein [Pseudomonadota bacterium]
MKKIIIASVLLLAGAYGCQVKPAAPQADNPPQAVKPDNQPSQSPEEIAAEKARHERDRAQAKKLADEGQILPPRVSVKLEILDHNDKVSLNDAELSYEFVKNAIRACYMRVLAFDSNAEGDITISLTSAENKTSNCTIKKTSITAEDFESCVTKACQHWPLPEGATLDIQMQFSSSPAPTVEEIRKINHQLEHDGGEHDHDGEDHE